MVAQAVSHYRILKKLGAGGMGEVYLAEDTRLRRKVAIKFVTTQSAGDDRAKRRLIREARAAAQLDHPNICAILEVGDEESRSFIVMQYVEGQTLGSILHQRRLSIQESLDFVAQILSALSEAHSHGIIHRDIKPQNVIIDSRGQLKVLDFGLAKAYRVQQFHESGAPTESLLTAPGAVMGTVGYMSPEQARGASIDPRSDIFSVGALLYECVTGRPAFSGNNAVDICAEVIHVNPPAASVLNPRATADLDRLIQKALAKKADERFQSAADMRAAVIRIADNQAGSSEVTVPLPKRPTGLAAKLFSTMSNTLPRARWVMAISAIVMILTLAAIWIGGRRARPGVHQPNPDVKRLYDVGTNYMREGAYFQASKAFERAIALDDEFALAHARLAEAWMELDYDDKAKDELLRVTALVPDRSSLSFLESLYLRVITDTVTRNFADAIESNLLIVGQVAEDDKPFAYLDLGRSYEKSEDIQKAVECYSESERRDAQISSAWLRLGVLHGRQHNLNGALDAFDKTERIYEALSNVEGITEVLYQRAVLFSSLDRLSDARNELDNALLKVQATNNQHQRIRILLQLSNLECFAGNTVKAEEYAEQSIALARANDMENLTTQGLIDLGRSFFLREKMNEGERYFKRALEIAQSHKGRRNEARALLSLASLRVQQDRVDEALQYLMPAVDFFEKGGYSKEYMQCLALLGQAHDFQGNYDAALQAYQRQNEIARQVNNPSQLAFSQNGIGLMLAYAENYPEALKAFRQSYSIYNSLNYSLYAGYSLTNCADVLWRLGQYNEAEMMLSRATEIAQKPDESYRQLKGGILLVGARLALSQRRFVEARRRAQQALDLAMTRSIHSAIEARCIVGLAQSLSGANREGMLQCQNAVDTAKQVGNDRLLGTALAAVAEASIERGDPQIALSTVSDAIPIFERSHRRESEWRAYLIAGRSSLEIGDRRSAGEYLSHVSSLLSELKLEMGDEAFSMYTARPDIQTCQAQLQQAVKHIR